MFGSCGHGAIAVPKTETAVPVVAPKLIDKLGGFLARGSSSLLSTLQHEPYNIRVSDKVSFATLAFLRQPYLTSGGRKRSSSCLRHPPPDELRTVPATSAYWGIPEHYIKRSLATTSAICGSARGQNPRTNFEFPSSPPDEYRRLAQPGAYIPNKSRATTDELNLPHRPRASHASLRERPAIIENYT